MKHDIKKEKGQAMGKRKITGNGKKGKGGNTEKSISPTPLSSSRSSKRTPSQSKEIRKRKSVNRGLNAASSPLHMVS
jgi:hypothetical protein